MNDDTMRAINGMDDYYYCVGRIIFFCQCIEHDVKLIYVMMRGDLTAAEQAEVMDRWTLGKTVKLLRKLDGEGEDHYLPEDDYDLFEELTKIRNHCAHECFRDWVYKEDGEFDRAFEKSARRMLNDHNRLANLYRSVERVRLEYPDGHR